MVVELDMRVLLHAIVLDLETLRRTETRNWPRPAVLPRRFFCRSTRPWARSTKFKQESKRSPTG